MRLLSAAAALTLAAAAPSAAQGVDPTQGVRIAVIDTGINAAHQEFAPILRQRRREDCSLVTGKKQELLRNTEFPRGHP